MSNGVTEFSEDSGNSTGSITYEAGKTLEVVGDDEVLMSIRIDGDKMVYGGYGDSYTLTEVK